MSQSIVRAGVAAAFCLAIVAPGVLAQNMAGPSAMMARPMRPVLCPATLQVKMTPVPDPVAGGWTANEAPFPVQLDPLNLPRIGMGTMSCYYKLLNQPAAFVIYQSVGTRTCTVRADHKGFDCT